MPSESRQLHLNANVMASGRHDAAWRLQDNPQAMVDVDTYCQIAQIAERGTFDAVFFPDGPQLPDIFAVRPWHSLDPVVLLAAMARATERIGLVATASTTFNEPYHVARRFATLDHVSKGRAAWNVVTSQSDDAAANFGFVAMPDHAGRYERAEEFIDVVVKLWDSFEDDAVIADQAAGRYVDPERVHSINHVGPTFTVKGPLNIPRPPQGRPVIVQAGASPASKRLGSRTADALFTVQRTFEEAQEFYAELKVLAAGHGRDPDGLIILPGLYPVVGSTESEARRRKEEMDEMLDLDDFINRLAALLNIDPADLSLDKPLPEGVELRVLAGHPENVVREARRDNLTVRQLVGRNSVGGHRIVVGAPEQIADNMEQWFTNRAADGFNLNMDAYPDGLELFVDHVVPELRRRGLFRREYRGSTLRDHLGLAKPPSQYSGTSPRLVGSSA